MSQRSVYDEIVSGELRDPYRIVVAVSEPVEEHASAPLDAVDSWWVSCDEGGYSLGPWKAHNLSVIEEIALLRRATHDSDGRPLCSGCGKPLIRGHTCR